MWMFARIPAFAGMTGLGEAAMSDRWFIPESFGAGIVPVSWKGVAAIAVYLVLLWTIIGLGVLTSATAHQWAVATITAIACGLLTFRFFRFAATKTDRTHTGEINYVIPPIDLIG